jgi:hypothetical protein
VVKEVDKGRDTKAETEVDELTDDLPHYASVGMFRNNNPSTRYRAEDCAAQVGTEMPVRVEAKPAPCKARSRSSAGTVLKRAKKGDPFVVAVELTICHFMVQASPRHPDGRTRGAG